MTEPNYKEIADRFYKIMKSYPYTHTCELLDVIDEYEKLHKSKMTFVGYANLGLFVYQDKDYALTNGFWYRCSKNRLYFIEDENFADELFIAQLEYEKSKPV